jgi:hypothetical protein
MHEKAIVFFSLPLRIAGRTCYSYESISVKMSVSFIYGLCILDINSIPIMYLLLLVALSFRSRVDECR